MAGTNIGKVEGKAVFLQAAGKRPVLWQPTTEGPGDPAWDGVLPADAVYMIWLNAASAKKYAQNGSDVVYTTPFYVAGMGSNGWLDVCVVMPIALLQTAAGSQCVAFRFSQYTTV